MNGTTTGQPEKELQNLKALLLKEYDAEKAAAIAQGKSMPLERKIRRGICWTTIRLGKSYFNSLNQYVVEVLRDSDDDIEPTFEPGKSVHFFHLIADETVYLPFVCTVNYADKKRLVVSLPDLAARQTLERIDNLGVELHFNELAYRLMFEALDRAINARDGRLLAFKEIFHGARKPSFAISAASSSFPWLNPSQEEAVKMVIRAKDVAIVHGPPGTGKTTTLVEAISETLMRENQVLVCAQSNMAVDWICEKLAERNINVLRIGNPMRVSDSMLAATYEHRFAAHPEYDKLWAIRKAIRDALAAHKKGDAAHQKISRLRERATELELRIDAQVFDEARVVASTLTGAANKVLTGKRFPTLFIDEAAQALEPACWIPLAKVGRVVFAGDHQQLPPTVVSQEAIKGGLAKTLMEHCVKKMPECVKLLTVQYRMNEKIMRLSSDWFYGGKLSCAPEVKFRGILDYDYPIEWIDTSEQQSDDFKEIFVGETFSRVNKGEALLTIESLKNFLSRLGKHRIEEERYDIGVISPYKSQVQLLRKLIKAEPSFKPFRHLISCDTVDGFQGQERDIIAISLVRSNDDAQIGFLNDLRRMNVAITRARMKLFIIGNYKTMSANPFYRKLYEYANDR